MAKQNKTKGRYVTALSIYTNPDQEQKMYQEHVRHEIELGELKLLNACMRVGCFVDSHEQVKEIIQESYKLERFGQKHVWRDVINMAETLPWQSPQNFIYYARLCAREVRNGNYVPLDERGKKLNSMYFYKAIKKLEDALTK